MDADLMVDGNADDGGIAEAAHGVGLFGRWQELEACDKRRVRLLNPLQLLK